MNTKRNKIWSAVVLGALGVGSSGAYSATMLEEILVTARKTQESLQSIPVAVTAMSSDAIENAQIQNVSDIQGNAPSVSMGTGSPGSSGFVFAAIRGQSSMNASVSVDPSVATYIDGVYIARPSQGTASLDDLERIEILRGPQGTLFGRNTTGGALNIVTKNPTDELEGTVSAGIGSDSLKEVGIRVNVPLSESAAVRFNYKHAEDDGWAENVTIHEDVGGEETDIFNAKLRIAPLDSGWSLILAGDYSSHKDDGQINQLTGVNPAFWPAFAAGVAQSGAPPQLVGFLNAIPQILAPSVSDGSNLDKVTAGFYANNPGFDYTRGVPVDQSAITSKRPFDDLEVYGGSATLEGALGDLAFKSISAYRYSDSTGLVDFDGSPLALLTSGNGYNSESLSQELQISGDITEKLNFISGVYYSTEDGEEFSQNQPLGILGVPLATNKSDIQNDTFGVYLQGYYDITDKLKASSGVRWTWDDREVDTHNLRVIGAPGDSIVGGAPPGLLNCSWPNPDTLDPCSTQLSESFDYPSWMFSLDYQLSDSTLVYAKTSRASKSGGWNLRVGSIPAFDPEELTDIEFGIKTDVTESVRLNAAYFHSWTQDVQRSKATAIGNPPASTAFIVNAGEIEIDGFEVEVLSSLWEGMELSFNGSWMEGAYENGSFTETQAVPGVGLWEVDRSDEEMIQTPEWQFGVSATQSIPFESGEAIIHLGYKWIDEQYFETLTGPTGLEAISPQLQAGLDALYDGAQDLNKVDSYGLLNGSLALNFDGGYSVSLWGNNLLDEEYFSRSYGDFYTTLGFAMAFVGEPRTFGINAKYSF